MKQKIIQNTHTKAKCQTRNLGRDGFFLLAKWAVLLIVLLWPSMEVLAQKKKQSINITSFERHEVSTESGFGNMADCCADAFACREGERLVGYAFVYHEFDSILSGSLYHFYVDRSHQGSYKSPLVNVGLVEVRQVEEILSHFCDSAFYRSRVYGYPTLTTPKNYCKYFRQYGFFVDSNGDSCAYVKFFFNPWKDSEMITHLGMEFVDVCDGGDHYWVAVVNLTRRKVSFWMVNGPECFVR